MKIYRVPYGIWSRGFRACLTQEKMPWTPERRRHKGLRHFFTEAGWQRYGEKCWRKIGGRGKPRWFGAGVPVMIHRYSSTTNRALGLKVLDRDAWQILVRDPHLAGL
jgi:hypothetical protein